MADGDGSALDACGVQLAGVIDDMFATGVGCFDYGVATSVVFLSS